MSEVNRVKEVPAQSFEQLGHLATGEITDMPATEISELHPEGLTDNEVRDLSNVTVERVMQSSASLPLSEVTKTHMRNRLKREVGKAALSTGDIKTANSAIRELVSSHSKPAVRDGKQLLEDKRERTSSISSRRSRVDEAQMLAMVRQSRRSRTRR